jgi:hypothetical protein
LVLRILKPIPVRKRSEVKAHPKSIAVSGVEAASTKVRNIQAEAATYALAEAIRRAKEYPSDWLANSFETIPADWMTMRDAKASRPAMIGDE